MKSSDAEIPVDNVATLKNLHDRYSEHKQFDLSIYNGDEQNVATQYKNLLNFLMVSTEYKIYETLKEKEPNPEEPGFKPPFDTTIEEGKPRRSQIELDKAKVIINDCLESLKLTNGPNKDKLIELFEEAKVTAEAVPNINIKYDTNTLNEINTYRENKIADQGLPQVKSFLRKVRQDMLVNKTTKDNSDLNCKDTIQALSQFIDQSNNVRIDMPLTNSAAEDQLKGHIISSYNELISDIKSRSPTSSHVIEVVNSLTTASSEAQIEIKKAFEQITNFEEELLSTQKSVIYTNQNGAQEETTILQDNHSRSIKSRISLSNSLDEKCKSILDNIKNSSLSQDIKENLSAIAKNNLDNFKKANLVYGSKAEIIKVANEEQAKTIAILSADKTQPTNNIPTSNLINDVSHYKFVHAAKLYKHLNNIQKENELNLDKEKFNQVVKQYKFTDSQTTSQGQEKGISFFVDKITKCVKNNSTPSSAEGMKAERKAEKAAKSAKEEKDTLVKMILNDSIKNAGLTSRSTKIIDALTPALEKFDQKMLSNQDYIKDLTNRIGEFLEGSSHKNISLENTIKTADLTRLAKLINDERNDVAKLIDQEEALNKAKSQENLLKELTTPAGKPAGKQSLFTDDIPEKTTSPAKATVIDQKIPAQTKQKPQPSMRDYLEGKLKSAITKTNAYFSGAPKQEKRKGQGRQQ